MAFKFGTSSLAEIKTVHPTLQNLCYAALIFSPVDFRILQGLRSREDQIKAFIGGFSKIDPRKGKVGRHMVGCAVDFMVIDPATNKFTFGKPALYAKVRAAFYAAAKEMKVRIRTLEQMGDLGHIELLKADFPDNWRKAA